MTGDEVNRRLEDTCPENPDNVEPLTESECLELLSSRHRRYVMSSLALFETPISLNRVTEQVTEMLYDTYPDEIVRKRERVYRRLYHNHIPRLERADVVAYDKTDGTLRPERNFGILVQFLAAASERDPPWSAE
jgi:hypothetical protein